MTYGVPPTGAGLKDTLVFHVYNPTLGTGASSGVRNPWDWPFSAQSFMNCGFGSGATWTSASDAGTAQIRSSTFAINDGDSANCWPIFVGNPITGDPLCHYDGGTDNTIRPPLPATNIYVPKAARPNTQGWVLFDKSQPKAFYNMYPGVTLDNGVDPTGGFTSYFGVKADTTGDGAAPTLLYGARNDGQGVIRGWEIDAGAIKHSLKVALGGNMLKSPGTSYTASIPWPYQMEDYSGPTSYTGNVLFGSTLGIPPTVLPPAALSTPGLALWRTLQTYGATVGNSSTATTTTFYADQDTGSSNSARKSWLSQAFLDANNYIKQNLCILTNQSVNGSDGKINGGGTYSAPSAPPFDPALGIGNGGNTPSATGPIPLLSKTDFPFTINGVDILADVGSCTVDFLINGVIIIPGIAVSTNTPTRVVTTPVAVNSAFSVQVSNLVNSPQRLSIALQVTRS